MNIEVPRQIKFATVVRADARRVFEAISTAEGLDGWFTTGSELDPTPGGRICFRWSDWGVDRYSGEAEGIVHAIEPPHRFNFEWQTGTVDPKMRTTVELSLEEDIRGTIVRVRESGFPDTPEGLRAFYDNTGGWAEALTLLKFFVEHGLRW